MSVSTATALDQLIALSHELGLPEHELAIFGEGNTSTLVDDDRFYVKVSGSMLSNIDANGFALLDRAAAEGLLDKDLASDQAVLDALLSVRVDGGTRYPSVETMMHAFLLGLPGICFVGHTHPTAVNAILCSARAEEIINMRLFPDQIVCCGPLPVWVPYTDPGLPLAREVRTRVLAWIEQNDMLPKAIVIQNHGLFALGATPKDVLSCSLMWQKTARVMLSALACGGINALPQAQVDRIFTRPDEKIREKLIGGK